MALAPVSLWACSTDAPGDGPRLYVTSGFTDEVLILDPADGALVDRREMDRRPGERDEPHGVAVAPDGRHWYATLSHGEPTLWKYETEGDRLVGRVTLPTAGAARIGVSPDGSRAVVPDYWLGGLGEPSRIAVVELASLEVVEAPVVCPAPHHAEYDPAGGRIAVTCSLSDEVVVLETGSLEVVARFSVLPAGTPITEAGNPVAKPMNLAWSPDGARLYVTLMRSGHLAAFRPGGDELWRTRVGASPAQVALTPDGVGAVVANRGDGTLAVVDTRTAEARALALDDALHPHGVALDSDGTTAFVTYEGTTTSPGGVVAVSLPEGRVRWSVEAGVFTLGVAWLPGTDR